MKELMNSIGYKFQDEMLLQNALTHSSYANEQHWPKQKNNERLEFLGDAVLELVTSDYLYHTYPDKPEGVLTRERAIRVCEPALAYSAASLSLGSYLYLGVGEEKSGGRERESVISNALEALIGAIYEDGGFESARKFILAFILKDAEKHRMFYDAKTMLQEEMQAKGKESPAYVLIAETGPAHDRLFEVAATLGGKTIGKGTGKSKKQAEQNAAFDALGKQ